MKKLRRFFLSRVWREKILLLLFVAIAAAIWGSSVSERISLRSREVSRTGTDLEVQRTWLTRRAKIEADAKAAVENLDPAKSFNPLRLNAELSTMAAKAELPKDFSTDSVNSEKTEDFSVHSVIFKAQRVSFDALRKFYDEIVKRAPYMGIEQFSVASTNDPSKLNVNLRVTSVEIAR